MKTIMDEIIATHQFDLQDAPRLRDLQIISDSEYKKIISNLPQLINSLSNVNDLVKSIKFTEALEYVFKQNYPAEIKSKITSYIINLLKNDPSSISPEHSKALSLFYLDELNPLVSAIDKSLSWENTCNELIWIYSYLIEIYSKLLDQGFQLDVDINKKFTNKVDALNSIRQININNEIELLNKLSRDDYEPGIANLLMQKLPSKCHPYIRIIPLEHLYIKVGKFPPGSEQLEQKYKDRILKEYTSYPQLESQKIKADNCLSPINGISTDISLVDTKENLAPTKYQIAKNNVEVPSEVYFAKLVCDFKIEITQLFDDLVNKFNTKEISVYSQEAEELYKFIKDTINSENESKGTKIEDKLISITDTVDAIKYNTSHSLSNAIQLMEQYTNSFKTSLITLVEDKIDPNKLTASIVNLNNTNHEALITEINGLKKDIVDSLDKSINKLDNFSRHNTDTNNILSDHLKGFFESSQKNITHKIDEFEKKLETFKGFLNESLISKLTVLNNASSDLSRNIKVSNSLLEKTQLGKNLKLVVLMLTIILVICFYILISNIFYSGSSNDKNASIELHHILDNINKLDSRNKNSVMQALQISKEQLDN